MNGAHDIVFMWVDDKTPGYGELLARYAGTTHDRNPNRTRDNLQTLRYALRGIERNAPWRRHIYLVTMRPQCPAWLNRNHPELRLVHHDEFIPAEYLPTFNSFAIQSCLGLLPGLSQRFVSFDDDMLLLRPTSLSDFEAPDGRIRYHFDGHLPRPHEVPSSSSPWNAALVNNVRLLDELTGPKQHPGFGHGPKMFDRGDYEDIAKRWPEALNRTRASRFRGHDNIALEALLPQYVVEQGRAVALSAEEARRRAYLGLENSALWNRLRLWQIARQGPAFLTLNDNFGPKPRPAAEAVVKRFLERTFPHRSRFEQD